ncbi:MAG: hypothetical protein GY925_16880 [Actinomycetia bacterium]|nr:hypothetical protein [Actinomycetes bacterium]
MPGTPFTYPDVWAGHRPRTPAAGPGGFSTYQIKPYWRSATCAEVDCAAYLQGWSTFVDVGSVLGREQADYLRFHSGRRFTEHPDLGGRIEFRFPGGQTCFAGDHKVPAEEEPIYFWRPGDHRGGYVRHDVRIYDRPEQWVDDFASNTDTVATARSRAGTGE